MSQLHTMNWQNKTEAEVISKFGQYKRKESLSQGYKIIFDYSTYIIPKKLLQLMTTAYMFPTIVQ